MTAEEVAELARLRALKAWRSPRFLELDRRAAVEASDRWRKADVWGHTFEGGA